MGITLTQKSRKLTNYSSRLNPNQNYRNYGNKASQKIFNELKKTGCVDRVKIAGSMGKKISWKVDDDNCNCQSDYDLVVFWNWDIKTQGRPGIFFSTVPTEIARYLKAIPGISNVQLKLICIQFEYLGYHFDLVPAINFSKDILQQKVETYKKLDAIYASSRKPEMPDSRFSAGLCEIGLQLFKSLNPFIRNLVRLCKIWYFYASPTSFPGSKLLIETIGIKCGQKILGWVKSKKDGCGVHQRMYFAFREFLRELKNFENLEIYITSRDTYAERNIPKTIMNFRPLVLDPANPYNNLAYKVGNDQKIMRQYSDCALYTLRKLDAIGRVLPNGNNITWRSIFSKTYEHEMYQPESDTESSSSESEPDNYADSSESSYYYESDDDGEFYDHNFYGYGLY